MKKILTYFIYGLFLGFAFLPLEFVLLRSSSRPVLAEDIRDSVRLEADTLRDEVRDMPCEDGSQETCGRPTPSRPPHRDPCPDRNCHSPEPSFQPSPQPSSPPDVSPSPGNGDNGGNGGTGGNGDNGDNGDDSGNGDSGDESNGGVSAEGQVLGDILGLSYTGS